MVYECKRKKTELFFFSFLKKKGVGEIFVRFEREILAQRLYQNKGRQNEVQGNEIIIWVYRDLDGVWSFRMNYPALWMTSVPEMKKKKNRLPSLNVNPKFWRQIAIFTFYRSFYISVRRTMFVYLMKHM